LTAPLPFGNPKFRGGSREFLRLFTIIQKILDNKPRADDQPSLYGRCGYLRLCCFSAGETSAGGLFRFRERRIFVSPGAVDMAGMIHNTAGNGLLTGSPVSSSFYLSGSISS